MQGRIRENKAQKGQAESDLSIQKNRCNKFKNKFERQKSAYKRIESDLKAYMDAVKKFESTSNGVTQQNASAIDACIASIDSYMSVNI